MSDTQGVPQVPSAATQGDASATPQGVTPSASAGDVASIQQFAVQPSADASATPQGQGVVQGDGTQAQTQPPVDEAVRQAQSLADKRLAENLALQQQLNAVMMQQQQVLQQRNNLPSQVQDPQPDPNQDPAKWWDWKLRQDRRELLEGFERSQQSFLNNLMGQAQDAKFMQDHPDANIVAVKQFAQLRGIQNLEDAHTVMVSQQQRVGAFQQGIQQGVQQFRQPTGAMPLRTQPSTQTPVPQAMPQFSFEATLKEYVKNPNIEASWPEGFKQAFWREANMRGMSK